MLVEKYTKGNGQRVVWMVKEFTSTRMDTNTKGTSKMDANMVMVS